MEGVERTGSVVATLQRLELSVVQRLDADRQPVHSEVDEGRKAPVVEVVGIRLGGHLGSSRYPERLPEGCEDPVEARGLGVGRRPAAEVDRVDRTHDLPRSRPGLPDDGIEVRAAPSPAP